MDNNGFVTVAELSEILNHCFPSHFTGKDITPFIKRYRSIQNKVLVEYRAMRQAVVQARRDTSVNTSLEAVPLLQRRASAAIV